MEILHLAAPCRLVPVTFTLDGTMQIDARRFQRDPDGTWSTGLQFTGMEERVKLVVRSTTGQTTRGHLAAGVEVAEKWDLLQKVLAPALFAFYCRVAALATDSGPVIASIEDVWSGVELTDIEVLADDAGRACYVHGVGRCAWEEEHGLEVVLRGTSELLYVGAYEGWVHGEPPSDHDWNFAIPKNQRMAMMERRPTDDEVAELALSQAPEPEEPMTKRTKNPWWKWW